MTDINSTETVNVDAHMSVEAFAKVMEELAKNPAVTDIKVTEGKDEVLPA